MGFLDFLGFICFPVGLIFVVIWRVGMVFICEEIEYFSGYCGAGEDS